MSNSYTQDQLEAIAAEFNAAGDNWQQLADQHSAVHAFDRAQPGCPAVIELDKPNEGNLAMRVDEPYALLLGMQYPDEPLNWIVLGWSNIGRARLGKRRVTSEGVEIFGNRKLVSNSLGEGYVDPRNPGATQYRDSDGNFSVQIWEN